MIPLPAFLSKPLALVALGAALGAGGASYALWDVFATREALVRAESALDAARRDYAALDAEARAQRARAVSAEIAMQEAQAFAEAQLLRAADLEDFHDEIYRTEGGEVPAPDILLRALGMRSGDR